MTISNPTTTPFGQAYIDDGIGYLTLREDLKDHMTIEEIEFHYELVGEMTKGEILPFIVDVSTTKPFILGLVPRKLIMSKYYLYATSYAYLSEDIANTFYINLFCKLAPTKVPMRIFGSKEKALEWSRTNNNIVSLNEVESN